MAMSQEAGSKQLIILRGLPGSGKTTLARKLKGDAGIICSTDDFFVENGRYNFDPSMLGENHEKNRMKAEESMKEGSSPIIIDNTNLTQQDMLPYVELGIKYQYNIELQEPTTDWKYDPRELARRNTHGLPEYKLERLLQKFERNLTVKSLKAAVNASTS